MADFRRTDWIRNAAERLAGSARAIQSSCLKGITVVKERIRFSRKQFGKGHYPKLIIASSAAVLVAVSALIGNYYVKANTKDYYKVYVNGELAGHVSSSDKVEAWLEAKAAELEEADTPVKYVLDTAQVTYEADRKFKPKTDDEGVLAKLEEKVEIYPVGVKIIVEGETVGVVRDHATAYELLAKIKNAYVPKESVTAKPAAAGPAQSGPRVQTLALSGASQQASAKPERLVESVAFEEKIDLLTVRLDNGKLDDPDELYEKLMTGNPEPIQYVVQKGDCISCIAQKLNVPQKFIYEKNPWLEGDKLQIGDVLDLTAWQPMVNVRSVEQVTQLETIEAPVEYKTSDELKVGQTKVIRQGEDGQKLVTYRQIRKNGHVIEEEIVEEHILKEPVSAIILKGTKVVAGEGTGKFRWPVAGHRVTSYQGERWGRYHKGIDITGKSTIMAADNGVVEFAGYKKGGLGNVVIIDHKNGFKTVYAHLKSIKVKKGQTVEKGEAIGIMGSTGNSTGVHLHFEVYYNGKLKNPMSYLK